MPRTTGDALSGKVLLGHSTNLAKLYRNAALIWYSVGGEARVETGVTSPAIASAASAPAILPLLPPRMRARAPRPLGIGAASPVRRFRPQNRHAVLPYTLRSTSVVCALVIALPNSRCLRRRRFW